MTLYHLEKLFPSELQTRLETCPVLLLSFGTIEWHSHHLPLGLDGLVAQALGEQIAARLGAVVAPISYWAAGGVPYPYTLNLPGSLIEPLLVALFEQFATIGFRVIVGLTGHFGLEQTLLIKRAALNVMRRMAVTILPITEYDLTTDIGYLGDHAGIGETSLIWALHPDLVRLDAVPADAPLEGVLGADPRGSARPEWGRELIDQIAERGAAFASRLLDHTTPAQRDDFVAALDLGVKVLEHTMHERQIRPKSDVPPVTTRAYLAYCQALAHGDYHAAQVHAQFKLHDLRA